MKHLINKVIKITDLLRARLTQRQFVFPQEDVGAEHIDTP
jgi:hypothetical protein